jgi:hypothetical protein
METFVRSVADSTKWDSKPESEWHLVASVSPNRIRMFAVHVNPTAQRYLTARHPAYESIVYQDDLGIETPTTADDVVAQLEQRLPFALFNPIHEGLGLVKELTEVIQTTSQLIRRSVLVVDSHGESRVEGEETFISESDMNAMRKAMDRIDRRKRDGVKQSKQVLVFNELLTKLDPTHFGRSEAIAPTPSALSSGRAAQRGTLRRQAGEAAISQVRAVLPVLAVESPAVLMQLQAEIERVTLAEMISKYEELLAQDHTEARWQSFFESYQFALAIALARPVEILQTRFHAQGAAIDGSGAQIGDFLLRQGRGLAIVEIKRPDTTLLSDTPYRNLQVFAPSTHLSGAVTQTLTQLNALRARWFTHQADDRRLRDSSADAVRCFVIAGKLPTDEHKLRSFDLFRNACKEVEVLTFDELLEKLKYIRDQLGLASPPAAETRAPS